MPQYIVRVGHISFTGKQVGEKKKKLLIKPCAPSVSKSKGLMRAQREEEIGSVPGR